MANVSGITLEIDVVNDGANLEANVTVEYDITFSSYDQHSNQPYSELCRLIGDDTGIMPAEDGVDDSIPGGRSSRRAVPVPAVSAPSPPRAGPACIATTGRRSRSAPSTRTPPVLNPDEIRAQVTLTPVIPVAVVRESNQVAMNIG